MSNEGRNARQQLMMLGNKTFNDTSHLTMEFANYLSCNVARTQNGYEINLLWIWVEKLECDMD